MSNDIYSNGIELPQAWNYAIQINYSGVDGVTECGSGTLKLQISNDEVQPVPYSSAPGYNPSKNVINWVDYSPSLCSTTVSIGSSTWLWNASYPGYRWVRFAYQAASGTGILSAIYFGKNA